jgi:hypothetical protein
MPVRNGYSQTFEEAQAESDHPQAKVFTPENVEVHVDAELEVLLTELWKLGYETLYSCQGGKSKDDREAGSERRGYIYFTTSRMGFHFLDVINQEIPHLEDRHFTFDDISCRTIRFSNSMIPLFEKAVKHFGKPINA